MARKLTEDEQRTFDQIKQQYDGLAKAYVVAGQLVVIRRASSGELHRYKDELGAMAKPSRRGEGASFGNAERSLAMACIAHPDTIEEKRALVELRPGLIGQAANVAENLAHEDIEEVEGN